MSVRRQRLVSRTCPSGRGRTRIIWLVRRDGAEQSAGAAELRTGPLVRPNLTQRANRRFPFVLAPFLIFNLVQVLKSGVSGWAILGTFLTSAYGVVIAAAALTLLLASVPSRPRRRP